jgi:hypothetical protein
LTNDPPPITHPGFFMDLWGGTGLADCGYVDRKGPSRHRPLMIPSVVEN